MPGPEGMRTKREKLSQGIHAYFNDCVINLSLPSDDDSENLIFPILDPCKLIAKVADKLEWFGALLRRSLQRTPPRADRPWSLIMYHDEVTCGNVLKSNNQRKATAFYFSFKEFELSLRDEDAWLCPAVITRTLLQRVKGGISCVLKEMLRHLFQGNQNLFAGIPVLLADQTPTSLVARMSNLLGDEAALKASLCAKGASGIKPCLQCKNIVVKGTLAQHDATGYLKTISCPSVQEFDLSSDADIWCLADNLSNHSGSKKNLAQLEKASGLNAVEDGILRILIANILMCLR